MFRFFNLPFFFFIFLLNLNSSCVQQEKKPEVEKGPNTWQMKMQDLARVFSELIPVVASDQKFSDPKNKELIERDTESLRKLAHSLKTSKLPKNSDPSLKITAELFEEDISRAKVLLSSGQLAAARMILRDTSSYCIQCHTQSSNGPNFPKMKLDFPTDGLSQLEKAELFVSLRRFDQALGEFTKIIEDKNFAAEHVFEWEQAARSAVAISVKVEKDPVKTLSLVRKIAANPSTPQFVKESVTPWEASVQEWRRERKPLLVAPPETLRSVEKMISRAQSKQKYPLDHSQDILFFRASGVLHDLLAFHNADDEIKAQALYLSGMVAEDTRDLNFWTLHETYYELCIRIVPHTDLARQCYEKLNNSMIIGYSGSAGTSIPVEIQTKLNDLKLLSLALPNPEMNAKATAPAVVPAPAPATAPATAQSPAPTAAPSAVTKATPSPTPEAKIEQKTEVKKDSP